MRPRVLARRRPVRGGPPRPPQRPRRRGWNGGNGDDGYRFSWYEWIRDFLLAASITVIVSVCTWISFQVGATAWMSTRNDLLAWIAYRPIR